MMSYPFCICLFGSLLNEYLGGCGEPFAPHVKTEPLSVGVLSTIDEFQESSRRRGEIKRDLGAEYEIRFGFWLFKKSGWVSPLTRCSN